MPQAPGNLHREARLKHMGSYSQLTVQGSSSRDSEPHFSFEIPNSELLGSFHSWTMSGQPGVPKRQYGHLRCQGGTGTLVKQMRKPHLHPWQEAENSIFMRKTPGSFSTSLTSEPSQHITFHCLNNIPDPFTGCKLAKNQGKWFIFYRLLG